MKTYGSNGGTSLYILKLGTRCHGSFTSREKLGRKLDEVKFGPDSVGEKKYLLHLQRIKPDLII
jgi:hypothetical protein